MRHILITLPGTLLPPPHCTQTTIKTRFIAEMLEIYVFVYTHTHKYIHTYVHIYIRSRSYSWTPSIWPATKKQVTFYLPFTCSFSEPSSEHIGIVIIKNSFVVFLIFQWRYNDTHESFNLFPEQLHISPFFFCNWLTIPGIRASWEF